MKVQGESADAATETATTTTSPPGLNVTEEGENVAKHFRNDTHC